LGYIKILSGALLLLLLFPQSLYAQSAEQDLKNANEHIQAAIQSAQNNDLKSAKAEYEQFRSGWYQFEDGIKKKSKGAYRTIEDKMGEIAFALAQEPTDREKVIQALTSLQQTNASFINGNLSEFADSGSASGGKASVAGLVKLLDQALADLQKNDAAAAKEAMEQFRQSWLDIEGVVLTQSNKVYTAAESDMVTSYALLAANPPDIQGAAHTIQGMRDYLEPLSGKSSYTMIDVITILLREGLEALLVVIALLGFLKKSGHEDKKPWIWYGAGGGIAVSVVLGVIVQLLFSSGAFGSNNFLIAGCTGLFAAVMLLYMSYWLHSKSSLANWQQYISSQSTRALAKGSLWSLAILSFLAVFREGTETVLFFIGMASSISLTSLFLGIAVGVLILVAVAFLTLKVGLKIPMRPFFLVSSVLVFYLCFKFLGMGIHGLQLAGVLDATHVPSWPTIDFLALYSTWENIIPQVLLLILAIAVVLFHRGRDNRIRKQLHHK
jgi:high-affinity iron transporter